MAKSRKKKKRAGNAFFSRKKIALIVLAIFLSFVAVYSVNYFELLNSSKKEKQSDIESTKALMDKMKKMLDAEKNRLKNLPKLEKEAKNGILPPIVHSNTKKIEKENELSEIRDYKNSLKNLDKTDRKKPLHVEEKYQYKGKPKLAIIIDDVAFSNQINLIKKIPFKVTPSFFPPTKRHPDTVKLAKQFNFAMVHLPMEALNYKSPERDTLMVGDSFFKMKKRIEQIKIWFPHIRYYNNHTGSKFTSDFNSMKKFFKIMKEENLVFVDSRTTADTKAPLLAKKYGFHLLSRDVFIDNNPDKNLIKKQLKLAIKLAKKRGYAIAIGHPHTNTLKVLINAKSLFRDVELVYIKEL